MGMNLKRELARLGVDMEAREFEKLVIKTQIALYPKSTDEQVLFHPIEAMRLCERVSRAVGKYVDHPVTLTAMVNARKRGRRFRMTENARVVS